MPNDKPAVVKPVVERLEPKAKDSALLIIPTSPQQMQVDVGSWCDGQLQEIEADIATADLNYEEARKRKWKSSPYKNISSKLKRRARFYRKIRSAIDAGYLIVPNFDMNVFAVRTDESAYQWDRQAEKWHLAQMETPHQDLEPGEGSMVGARPLTVTRKGSWDKADGSKEVYWTREAYRHTEVDFPIKLVHPAVLSATGDAAEKKIFDEIGVASGGPQYGQKRKKDPIVCGRIIDRTRSGHAVTFFVGWWLDLRAI